MSVAFTYLFLLLLERGLVLIIFGDVVLLLSKLTQVWLHLLLHLWLEVLVHYRLLRVNVVLLLREVALILLHLWMSLYLVKHVVLLRHVLWVVVVVHKETTLLELFLESTLEYILLLQALQRTHQPFSISSKTCEEFLSVLCLIVLYL